jgi:23S rRNA pseudouridine955/2504/2580 synthase
MMKRINETTIAEDAATMRLDRYLARRFTYLSRTQWQREIRSGKISINGMPVQNAKRRLLPGDTVGYDGRDMAEPPVDPEYRVLYEDDRFLAVSKSGDLPTHPSGRYFANTLLMLLQEARREKLFPLHRLDRETSGVILFARDQETAAAFQKGLPAHIKPISPSCAEISRPAP